MENEHNIEDLLVNIKNRIEVIPTNKQSVSRIWITIVGSLVVAFIIAFVTTVESNKIDNIQRSRDIQDLNTRITNNKVIINNKQLETLKMINDNYIQTNKTFNDLINRDNKEDNYNFEILSKKLNLNLITHTINK